MDEVEDVRRVLAVLAEKSGEWAGLPMSLEGESLVIHPKYRWARVFNKEDEESCSGCSEVEEGDDMEELYTISNKWTSRRTGMNIFVMKNVRTGRAVPLVLKAPHRFDFALRTLGPATAAWSFGAETKALGKLCSLVETHILDQYIMTGCFIETSRRSGITYMFRKVRPTIAFREDGEGGFRIIAALCMHSIGYYKDTHAGCLTPTDDVVSHLLMMRGDEHGFWKMSSQHPEWAAEAGV